MKKTFIFILSLFLVTFTYSSYAEEVIIDGNIIEYKKNLSVDESLTIDLNDFKETLGWDDVFFEWSVEWESTIEWEIFEQTFEKTGIKEINLNIFKQEDGEKKFILNSKIDAFIYEESIPFIFSEEIEEEKILKFIDVAQESWVYIHNMGIYKEKDLTNTNFPEILKKYKVYSSVQSDYIGMWWEKEFIFTALSTMNKLNLNSDHKMNIVALSGFNTNILKSYLKNFVSNKNTIKNVVIMDDSLNFQITKNPWSINALETELSNNSYDFLKIQPGNEVNEIMFISKFINNLSNQGFSTSDIYIIILLPFLFTLISFFKHLIWVSPMGLIITVLFSVLFFKVWALASTVVMGALLLINLAIWKVISKQTLLYTPKISFIITINIILFIAILNILFKYEVIDVNLSDTIYVILFVIVSERLINVIVSKEFKEYKNTILHTFIVAIVAYMIFSIGFVKVFILAYPEIIVFLAPINYVIGKFTGLRITEYLRFKEVINNIEE